MGDMGARCSAGIGVGVCIGFVGDGCSWPITTCESQLILALCWPLLCTQLHGIDKSTHVLVYLFLSEQIQHHVNNNAYEAGGCNARYANQRKQVKKTFVNLMKSWG